MLRSLWNGASALNSQQTRLDNTANNIANINTPGFRNQRVSFGDLLYKTVRVEGNPVTDSQAHSGVGNRVTATLLDQKPGSIVETGRPLDVAIKGEGFFRLQLPGGEQAYTRNGIFYLTSEGFLVNEDGYRVQPEIRVQGNFTSLKITSNGGVLGERENGEEVSLGQIKLYKFQNPAGLKPIGRNSYQQSVNSGAPLLPDGSTPGNDGTGALQSGALEMSNTNLAEEFTEIILAQRIYQVNLRAIQTADEMWNIANNIRK